MLCKKCGLIRSKKRLNESSTKEFYKNEYRDIYEGKEEASDKFFSAQVGRRETFYKL